jgi:hypothetical protein
MRALDAYAEPINLPIPGLDSGDTMELELEDLETVEAVEFDDPDLEADLVSPAESAFLLGYEERPEEEDFWETD